MITVIDYGMGNIASVLKMIRWIGGEAALAAAPDEVKKAKKLILPGVGAFDAGITALRQSGLDLAIAEAVKQNGSMILGICLGMQLLLESSEEGSLSGLALVPGRVRRFQTEGQELPVPHMGWNAVRAIRECVLFGPGTEPQRYYFVHSYFAECADPADVTGLTYYGRDFTSAFERGRVLGTQFHPEKSHRFGMALLKRFVAA